MDLIIDSELSSSSHGLMNVEAVQKALNRSRASIYRYANTDPTELNPAHNPKQLNPEFRISKDEPLLFHPNEVARFAKHVLGINQVTIEIQESAETATHELLRAILAELKSIHHLLESRS